MPAYGPLRVTQEGNVVALQPVVTAGQVAPTLSLNLTSRKLDISSQSIMARKTSQVLALLGVMRFKAGTVVVLVTEAQMVASLHGQPVFRITGTKLIKPNASFDSGERRLLAYLADAVNPKGSGRNMFFSYGDLTLSSQRLADVVADAARAEQPPAARADPQFFWNRQLAQPLVEAGGAAFPITAIVGSVGAISGVQLVPRAGGAPMAADLVLVARRSADRCGTRHWRRGVDTSGAAANFVETEQVVTIDGGRILASSVQVRGSIPLIWTQLPNIKYKPPTKMLAGRPTSAAFDAHMDALLAKYKAANCINLVNQHGSEGQLEAAFGKEAARYKGARGAPLSYTAFDFHKECGATNYGRLSLLWAQLEEDYKLFGMYIATDNSSSSSSSGPKPRRQAGVFRTNCVDCLDRTNVVQGVIGRKALEGLLVELGVIAPGATLAAALPQVEAQFKVLWADHGDDISGQYAGTGALKSGFTRTGKRTLGGLIDDGVKSMGRYYLNNFQDGHKQDALDLMCGSYKPKPDVKLRFQAQHSPALPLLVVVLAVGYALHGITLLTSGSLDHSSSSSSSGEDGGMPPLLQAVAQHILLPLVGAGLLMGLVVKNGKWLVDRPQLCPHLANTVAYAADSDDGRAKQS